LRIEGVLLKSQPPDSIPWLLRNVSEATKEYLRTVSTVADVSKNDTLPPQSNPPKDVIFVESGWFSVTIHDSIVSILKKGDTFMGPILPYGSTSPSSITLTAVTPATAILIKRVPLLTILHERPDLLFSMYEQASERVTRLLIRTAHQQVDPLELRLASFLWSLALPREDGNRALPSINQSVLAACLGTGREEVSRKRQILVQKELIYRDGPVWVLTQEVGRMLAARGYGE
jgi:CRP-like cAMP-binding protein